MGLETYNLSDGTFQKKRMHSTGEGFRLMLLERFAVATTTAPVIFNDSILNSKKRIELEWYQQAYTVTWGLRDQFINHTYY